MAWKPAQLTARLSTVAAQLRAEDPRSWIDRHGATRRVTILRELDSRFATSQGAAAGIATSILGAIAVIVALACVNLATMVMARGAARTFELNVRLALGASRRRLLRQLATESLLVAVMGAAAGLAIVAISLKVLEAFRPPELPAFNLEIDWRVVGFATFSAIVTPLLFGLGPGAHAVRLAIAEGLKGTAPLLRRRWFRVGARELLLVVQVTVSFGLVVMAAMFARGLMTVSDLQAAALSSRLTMVSVDLGPAANSDAAARDATARLFRAAATAPGVERWTAAGVVPVTGSSIGVATRLPDQPDAPEMSFDANIVAPGYFDLTGVRLRAGRDFDDRDHERAPGVAIVSEALARRVWGSAVAVGRTLEVDDRAVEIVGIVPNRPYRTYTDTEAAVIYLPFAQAPHSRFILHLRLTIGPEGIVALDRHLRTVDARIRNGGNAFGPPARRGESSGPAPRGWGRPERVTPSPVQRERYDTAPSRRGGNGESAPRGWGRPERVTPSPVQREGYDTAPSRRGGNGESAPRGWGRPERVEQGGDGAPARAPEARGRSGSERAPSQAGAPGGGAWNGRGRGENGRWASPRACAAAASRWPDSGSRPLSRNPRPLARLRPRPEPRPSSACGERTRRQAALSASRPAPWSSSRGPVSRSRARHGEDALDVHVEE